MTIVHVFLILVVVSASAMFVHPILVVLLGGLACVLTIAASCAAIPFARFKKWPLRPLIIGGTLSFAVNLSVSTTQ
jgi:hypothetical protein